MSEKRYYWLKLPKDFFNDKAIKKLRKIAGGDTYTIIYLKMLLASLTNEGRILYEGIEDSVCDEIALELDEESENVKVTMQFLLRAGLLIEDDDNVELTKIPSMLGSESSAAERMRRMREAKKSIEDRNNVTVERNNVTPQLRLGDVEKEIEIDTDIDKKKSKSKPKRFTPPSLEEVQNYIKEKGYHIDAETFIAFYESKGWLVGNQKMKSWKGAVVTWEKRRLKDAEKPKEKPKKQNQFNSFHQREYNFDELEADLFEKQFGG